MDLELIYGRKVLDNRQCYIRFDPPEPPTWRERHEDWISAAKFGAACAAFGLFAALNPKVIVYAAVSFSVAIIAGLARR